MRLTTHTYAEKENRVGRMLQRAAFFILHSSFFILLMASCSSDDATEGNTGGNPATDNGKLTLRIATQSETRARDVYAWKDANGQDDEMMNLWVVILTNEDGEVQKSWACRPTAGAEQEIDEIGEITKGAYVAYSFANISVENVCTLLGLTAGTVPTIGSTPTELAVSGTITQAAAAAKTATINGNGFNPNAADNGYGEKGIPMSNVQTIAATDTEKDLIVVRMLAKMTISVKNETGAEQYIKYATISNVTDNVANNLKLLPTLNYKDDMEAHHADIRPNLNGTPTTVELAIPNLATAEALANNATREVTFYINECKTGTDFNLTIGLGNATDTKEYRYALIDSKGATTADDDKWDYIARNDYRIIPITLDDYKFEIIPYDFPPIGVYPVSVSEIDNVNHIYNFTFHDYGHFHLLPKVTKVSTPSSVPFGTAEGTGTRWTLNTNWAGTWYTAATKGDAWLDAAGITSNGFYRNQTATADGDEVGGVPYWYLNDGAAGPQWDPAGGTSYQPFIFGYIAEPATLPMEEDKKIYHEMKIKLYVDGTYRRDMLYRFYMTLSKDQMLYAPAMGTPAPRRSHHQKVD